MSVYWIFFRKLIVSFICYANFERKMKMHNQPNILLVDDEQAIVKMLETVLLKEGFNNIYKAYTAEQALQIIEQKPIDIILLDVMLPDFSGFELCPKIKSISDAYILFLTAKVTDLDKLTGFAIGADDYITKPFNPLEIVARINARLRRVQQRQNRSYKSYLLYECERFTVDERSGELRINGENISCPAQVYRLLLHFCKYPNQIFSKNQLLDAVWGEDRYIDDNTVIVHIRRLREYIEENPSRPKYLLTVRGLGYKLIKESK